ncbi:long-chain fatty acid--CoA ligase [Craurococcus roseus]|uniref:Long-chain fatty acid--CoA ligase n=1 Tax=Craurococcus roseus TaxID=77585 RepID=A0ABN1F259_9PROT
MSGAATVDLPVHGAGEPRPPFATLCAMFDHAVATTPGTVSLRHLGASVTYREEGRAASALARRLAAAAAPGEAVALLLPNSIEFRVAFFAALKALAAPALLNPLYPGPQLEPLLRDAAPRAVVCSPATHELVLALAASLGIPGVVCLGRDTTVAELAAEPEAPPLGRRAAEPGDVAALLFSGGTTGVPKAVEHTHGRLVVATRCMEYCWPTRASGEVWLPVAPFTHIYGFLQGVLCPVSARAETVVPERFKPEHVVELMAGHRVTVFGGGPPAIYAGVLSAPNLAGADLSALRVCPAGGAPMPVELLERWRRATGREIHEGYGMTEIAPISGTNGLTGVRPGSVGKAVPCNEVQVVDLETGARVLPLGERGEVRVRGPHMMAGYRGRPEETAQAIRGGFVYTGDIGHLDADGFLFITDRKKDVVLVKGFNVFPREVEEAIYAHPKVAAAGVVGAPDPRTGGERLVAYVVPRADEALSEAEIAAHCAERLVGYKVPDDIRVVEALPMTGAQKLDRMALRRMVRDEAAGGG